MTLITVILSEIRGETNDWRIENPLMFVLEDSVVRGGIGSRIL